MAKKSTNASEPVVSSGVAPARSKRKHAPAKHIASAAGENSMPTDSSNAIPAMTADRTEDSHFAVTQNASVEAPSFDDIARLAYFYAEARGFQGGSPEDDWLRAERELRNSLLSPVQA
jgi:hypothetical protein